MNYYNFKISSSFRPHPSAFQKLCVSVPLWLILVFLLSIGSWPQGAATAQAQTAPRQYFSLTGHSISGRFLQFWQSRGGLAIFGYPLTDEIVENGKVVQYFERNRFELFPELANQGYDVQLGLLGVKAAQTRGINQTKPFERQPAPATKSPEVDYFELTGHTLRNAFRKYWYERGGLAVFGYPISEEFQEISPTDGKTRLVQYFERNRFEYFPDLPAVGFVQLGLLGSEQAKDNLDRALLEPWPVNGLGGLQLTAPNRPLQPLEEITVKSGAAGQLKVLGGDNRSYASFEIPASGEIRLKVGGAPGTQSLMFYRQGQLTAAQLGVYTLATPETSIQSGDAALDSLYPQIKRFLQADAVNYRPPTKPDLVVHGYRSPDTPYLWLRDHVHQSKGFKYFEPEMFSVYDYFKTTQKPDGSFDDYFQDSIYGVYGQIEVEADREYLFVEGVWNSWQASGDDIWLKNLLPVMERGLEHTFSDPKRWSSDKGLVKRAFTIDTWDFEYNLGGATRRTIDDKTQFGIMHGDNTGAYDAARKLAYFYRYFGRNAEADKWDNRASNLLKNLIQTSWNGRFFTHRVPLVPPVNTGVDEAQQLSLSNAYALNRGVLSQAQAAQLIREYQTRRANTTAFAEWFSIDPPFTVGFGAPGEYVNGGIMPLVGGELARGAFDNGFEAYGLDILRRYRQLIDKSGGSYLWYYPDGRPGVITGATLATDGWGSAAMLYALTEGLAGVRDTFKQFQTVELSPRWAITDRSSATVTLRYGASDTYFSYSWQRSTNGITLQFTGAKTESVKLHLLLPPNISNVQSVKLNGANWAFTLNKVENSSYIDLTLPGYVASLEIAF